MTIEHQLVNPRALQIELTDLVGRSIVQLNVEAQAEISRLQLPQVPAGLYLLRVRDAQGIVFTDKIRIAR